MHLEHPHTPSVNQVSSSTIVQQALELRLIALGQEVGRGATRDAACAIAAQRVGAALGVPCAVRAHDGTEWRVIACSRSHDAIDPADATRIPLGQEPASLELLVATMVAGELAPDPGTRLIDHPEWRDALGAVLASALELVDLRIHHVAAARRAACLARLSRALIGSGDSAALHRAIVQHMADAVDATIGAVAVFVPQENSLAITATLGYPSVLVEHVRIAPGEGVLGRVFATGEPVLVPSVSALHGSPARRRYRTDSYLALPLTGPEGVVAVVSLTDKKGGGPFSQVDLDVLLAIATPASLAVARELLRDRTNDLAHLATVDALTGLFNRRYFETRLEQELQRQVRQPDDLSLLMLDLDNFKELNDTQGHLVGDLALREVADILRRAVRIFDVCARYGGEEFVILMPGAGCSTALRIAERIRRQVEQHFATGLRSGVPGPLTVSVGVATARPNVTRDALVAQADEALLRAKGTGKNQVNLHQESAR